MIPLISLLARWCYTSAVRTGQGWMGLVAVVGVTAYFGLVGLSALFADELLTKPGQGKQIEASSHLVEIESRLQADMAYLASDELAGRDVGSEGISLASQHIAREFAEAGLQTDLFDGTPFQTFKIPLGVSIGEASKNRLTVTGSAVNRPNESESQDESEPRGEILGETFRPMAIGASGAVSGPMLFAGYGISAPELQYDDYAAIDPRGAVVMILRKEPQGLEADKRFDGSNNTRHAFFDTKVRAAAQRGAVAILLVNDDDSIALMTADVDRRIEAETKSLGNLDRQIKELPTEADNLRRQLSARRATVAGMIDDLHRQRGVAGQGLMSVGEAGEKTIVKGVPVVSISRSLATRLIQDATGQALDEIKREIDEAVVPRSFNLQAKVELEVSLSPAEADSSNVLGVLPGRGRLAEETIVIGAHYDHVGMGGPGSLAPGTIAIHNGADDNASGTSVLLSSVHHITDLVGQSEHRRRIVFIAFTGEERGLLGSEHYVTHPRFPLENTVAMINLDMVGRLRNNDLTVYGTGTAPGFDELVERANVATGFQLFKVSSGYGPSDHQSFYTRKVPVLFFFTGLHSDYHRPTDKIDKINLNGMARITDITARVVVELATTQARPGYAATDRDVQIRHQTTAYLGVSLQPNDSGEGVDQDPQGTGLASGAMVSGVAGGSPAARAGIRTGDRLRRINAVEIKSVSDVIAIVAEREVDDEIKVELDRAGERVTVTARLQRRPDK